MGIRRKSGADAFARATLSQIELTLAAALPQEILQRPASGPHSRRRVYSLPRTFWCWIWQIFQRNTSCRQVVQQVQAMLGLMDLARTDEDCSAYCQARLKMPMALLDKALNASYLSAEKQAAPSPLLQGRPIKIVDGSSVRLEDTPKNRAEFPHPGNQFSAPRFPVMRFLALFSLASGSIIARAIGGLKVSELRLMMSLRQHIHSGDIVAGDRAYGLYVTLHWISSLGADMVARLNTLSRHVDFRKAVKRLGPQDGLFLWQKPKVTSKLMDDKEWEAVPQTMLVRIIRMRIERPGFRTREITIATTLLDERLYGADQIVEVYFKRWRLEMCLDDLKTTLGMEKLHCLTPQLAQKELAVFLIAHNFIRWIMGQAAQEGNANLERVSFTGTLDAFGQWSEALAQVRGPGKLSRQKRLWREMLQTLAADLVPERPGRQEPRAVKKRSKYPHLTKPRSKYVERWSRNKRRRAQRAKASLAAN
jgi:hypothetical protein